MKGTGPAGHFHQLTHLGTQISSGCFMDLVTVRCSEKLGIAGHEAGGQRRHPGEAAQHHRMIMGIVNDSTCRRRRELRFGNGDDRPNRRVKRETHWHPFGRNEDKTAVYGCRRLIGVTFVGRGHSVDTVQRSILPDGAQGSSSCRHVCGGRGSEAARQGHVIVDPQSERSIPHRVAGGRHDSIAFPRSGPVIGGVLD